MDRTFDAPADRPRGSWFGRLWRFVRTTLVVLFVCWHLFFMLVRNSLDLWEDSLVEWASQKPWWPSVEGAFNHVTYKTWYYGNFTGCEQGWGMFAPPMGKTAAFMGGKLIFSDGSHAVVTSPNEPDPTNYFRLGDWRHRKLEDCLYHVAPAELPDSSDLPVYSAFIRWYVRTWKEAHPDDPRTVSEVHLINRWYTLPGPDQPPSTFAPPEESVLGVFSPQGEYLSMRPAAPE